MVFSIKSKKIPIILQVGVELDIFANDLSFDRRFVGTADFIAAFSRIMKMKVTAKKFDFEVYYSRRFLEIEPVQGVSMHEALNGLSRDQIKSAKVWLTRVGPFLEDFRRHDSNEYFECNDEVVTDSVVGEAAFRKINGLDSGLISAETRDWNYHPVTVIWRQASEELDDPTVELSNWRDIESLENALQGLASPVQSWNDLKLRSITRFERLSFAEDSFDFLINGTPFVYSAANQMLALFTILDQFAGEFYDDGARTTEGHKLHQDYFTGDRARFSDSSETKKRNLEEN